MSKLRIKLLLSAILALGVSAFATPFVQDAVSTDSRIVAKAEDYGDDVGGNDEGDKGGSAFQDYMKDYNPMTDEQFAESSAWASFLTGIAGNIIGVLVVIITAFIFVVTALDLAYLALPPIRKLLYKPGTDGTGAQMGGGYGMRGGMMGGGQQAQGAKPTQWISDECVQVAAMLGGAAQTPQMGGGMMGGGYGGYGGGMGMMGGGQQQQPMTTKSAISEYLKKRVIFMVILAICMIVLLSSVLLGTGINLGQWFVNLVRGLNDSIPH